MDFLRLVTGEERKKTGENAASAAFSPVTPPPIVDTQHPPQRDEAPVSSSVTAVPSPITIPTTFVLLLFFTLGIGGAWYYFVKGEVSSNTVTTSMTIVNPTDSINQGLVAHYTFDGQDMDWASTTAEVRDRSGNNNHGNLMNAGATAVAPGKLGQAMKFDGVDDVVTIASTTANTDMSIMTISAWIKPITSGEGSYGRIVTKASGISNGWSFYACSEPTNGCSSTQNKLNFYADFSGTDGVWTSSDILRINQWQHVVIIYDFSSTTTDPTFYINARNAGVIERTAPVGVRATDMSSLVRIGNSLALDRTFDGTLDDVRIYNRALSVKEVERLYKLGEGVRINASPNTAVDDGLVGHWTFDGQDMLTATNTVIDRSPTKATGTLMNMDQKLSRAGGKLGQALKFFDGQSDYVVVSDTSALDIISQVTLSAWVKQTTLRAWGNYAGIINKGTGASGTSNFNLMTYSVNNKEYISFGYYNAAGQSLYGTTTPVTLNEWHHLVATYDDSANVINLYVDGILQNKKVESGNPENNSIIANNQSLYIGTYDSFNYSFPGTIDDVRIYNRALSAEEVEELYNSGKVTTGICGEGPVLDASGNKYGIVQIGTQCWLDRNMNVGTRINSSSNQTNNATIEKWCYNNLDSNCTSNNPKRPDGGLYQWNEAMQYSTTPGARGICPQGWHIPTDAEWNILESTLKNRSASCNVSRISTWDCADAGLKLRPDGSSSFHGNIAGYVIGGTSNYRGTNGNFWSSTETGSDAMSRSLGYNLTTVYRKNDSKTYGYSVRCVKDN